MSDIQVKIESIIGESDQKGYAGQIDCISMRHAIDMPVVATSSSRIEGSSVHGPIELTHAIDRATPLLRAEACAGTNLNTVVITRLGQVDGETQPVETITLKNAYVVRVEAETLLDPATMQPADEPLETFSLEYGEIVWNFSVGNSRGGYSPAKGEKV